MKELILYLIISISAEYGIPWQFVKATVAVESEFNPRAVSPENRNGTRDWGLMQLNENYFCLVEWYDPETNIRRGVAHIRWLVDHPWTNTWWSVAVAYNAGINRINTPPDSTLRYADNVMRMFNEFSGGSAPALLSRSVR